MVEPAPLYVKSSGFRRQPGCLLKDEFLKKKKHCSETRACVVQDVDRLGEENCVRRALVYLCLLINISY